MDEGAQENVRRRENGAEGARLDLMLRLLVEEENKVGVTYEQLDEVLRQIGHIQTIRCRLQTPRSNAYKASR
jgi:hypothetical protein